MKKWNKHIFTAELPYEKDAVVSLFLRENFAQVDDFIISMNRAAEKAAPQAASLFVGAIKEMTLEDAKGILTGGDTSATDYSSRKKPRITFIRPSSRLFLQA